MSSEQHFLLRARHFLFPRQKRQKSDKCEVQKCAGVIVGIAVESLKSHSILS